MTHVPRPMLPLIVLAAIGLSYVAGNYAMGAYSERAATIRMTPGAFEPAELYVERGTEVTFVNADTEERWPASDIHPTHGVYPAFDPQRPLLPGESWSFTFDRGGKWRFHDHLYPDLRGVVTVAGSSTPSETLIDREAVRQAPDTSGFETLAAVDMLVAGEHLALSASLVKQFGIVPVMQDLIADAGGGSVRDCHAQAHNIGRVAYELYGAEAFRAKVAHECHSGFFHGAMESLLFNEGTDDLAAKIGALCKSFDTDFGIFECLHGVGHGVLAFASYDLPGALDECATLETDYDRTSCYGGVFMENIMSGQKRGAVPGHETAWLSDDPHFPCDSIGGDFARRYQCYQMQTSWMMTLYKDDFARIAKECLGAPEDMTVVCFKSLGRDAAGATLRNSERIIDICAAAPRNDLFRECLYGGLNVIVDFWGPGLQGQAAELCSLVSDSADKRYCYERLAERFPHLTNDPAERARLCATFEPAHREVCSF